MALKQLVQTLAEALVDDPASVDVAEIEGDNNIILELRVAKNDIGKVIGKDGRTAQSLRTIVSAASIKIGRRPHPAIIDGPKSPRRAGSWRSAVCHEHTA